MDGEPPQEEDFSQIPIIERSQHKNWKARLSAYNEVISKAAKTASDTDPFFRPYVNDGQLLRKWTLDANAVAQEKGIEAVLAIVEYSGESSSRTRSDVIPAVVEKSLGAMRAGTKKKGLDVCLMYAEVENTGDGVIGDVMAGLDAKQPKVVAGCVNCLKELVESFGVPAVGNIKPILKSLSKIFGHTDKTVRAEGTALAQVLYSFLGPALQPSLADLKPVQVSDLQKAFDAMDADGKGAGTGKATRYTRQAQRDRDAAGPSGDVGGDEDGGGAEEPAAPPDPRSFLDPVNVLSLFPSDLEDRLSSTKWKDRVEVLEECNKVLGQPTNARISDSNVDAYGSLASTLGTKCKGDANINVVMEAAKVIEGISVGMGKPFGRFRGVMMPGILERLKERKPAVVEVLGKGLDAVFTTVPISDIVDDVLTSTKSKNPQVREHTLKFLHRCLQTTTEAPGKDQVKPIAEALVALLGDSTEPVRSSAADCLGTMMKILGERAFNPYIENVGELQMAKVKDAFAKAEIKYKAGGAGGAKPGARPAPTGAVKPAPIKKAPVLSSAKAAPAKPSAPAADELLDDFAPPAKKPPARFARPSVKPESAIGSSSPAPKAPISRPPPAAVKKPTPAPTPAAGPSRPAPKASSSSSSKTLAVSPTEPVKYKYTPEDAAARAADLIPAEYHTKFADPAWKIRLEAGEELVKWVTDEDGAEKVDCEVMMRFVGKTPGWGEKNFQVSAKVFQVMAAMAEKSPTFGRPSAALTIGPLSEKLGDMKLKKPAGDALTMYAEKTSLAFVFAQAYEPLSKQKAPKAQADALTWMKQVLTEFGIAGIPLRDLIAFVKTGLQSPNALVRASATQVLVTIRIFVGADIGGFLEDLNPQLLSTINSEFDKVSGQTPPEPTRTSADLQEVAGGGKAGGKTGGGGDPLDDLIPRVDLDKLVNQTSILNDSKSDAWKVRKEAFEALNALLEVKSNQRLKPNMGEISNVLKKAMADTNLSVKMLGLGIISKIAMGMGPPFEKYMKIIVGPVATVCADNKATTRTAGINTLTAIGDGAGSLNGMYPGIATALETNNPALRSTVLAWLGERLQAEAPGKGADLAPLAAPVISCLEDRNGDVRKAAGVVLPFVVANAGYDFVMDQTSNLKPASKATILPLINNAKITGPGGASSAASAIPANVKSAANGPPSPAAGRVGKISRTNGTGSPRPAAMAGRSIAPPARSQAMKALGTTATSRPASSLSDDRSTGPSRSIRPPGRPISSASHATSAATSATPVPSSSRPLPFTSASMDAKSARVKRDSVKWMLETPIRPELTEYLSHQMEPYTSPELFSQLFSKDHRAEEDFMVGLSALSEFYSDQASHLFEMEEEELVAFQLANVDLALKYSAVKLLANNTQLGVKCLDVISHVIDTMSRLNERFSDPEAKLWVPALITKLGDAKFGPKLAPIFESLDKVIAGSQGVQLLVQHGLEDKSAGKTCKNESLLLIEKAYRKRGSILRTRDDRGFYETIAKCISDSGTRNAALSLMALLQLQGGSASLNAVIETMPQASKDMLSNRKATIATTKSIPTAGGISRPGDGGPGSPARRRMMATPGTSRTPRPQHEASSDSSSPPNPTSQRSIASPRSRIPNSPSASRLAAPTSRLAEPGPSKLARHADPFGGASSRPAMQPLGRGGMPSRVLNGGSGVSTPPDPVISAINDIRNESPARSVDALKRIQNMLSTQPDAFLDNIQTLIDALTDELDRAFSPVDNLHDPQFFRLVKHIFQTINTFSTNQDLMRRLGYDEIYSIISVLTLRMVQADPMGGQIQELTRFINMLLIQILAGPDRKPVFKAMFALLLDLTKDFSTRRTPPDDDAAVHADLVIKCMWKRCKVLDDDLKSGRLDAGALLGILEEFMRGVSPAEYRRREMDGIALGDMPLRTVKAIIQKVVFYAKQTGQEIYDILLIEFGDAASDTVIYPYVFRLAGLEANRPASGQMRQTASNGGSGPSSERGSNDSPEKANSLNERLTPVQQVVEENEAEKLVKNLLIGQQNGERFDALYAFMKANPDREHEVQAAISKLHTTTVQTYIRRALANRQSMENATGPAHDRSFTNSPSRPGSVPDARSMLPTKMDGMRPSSLQVDNGASRDDQLAHYKSIFNRTGSQRRRSRTPEGSPHVNGFNGSREERSDRGGSGEPLTEIALQQRI